MVNAWVVSFISNVAVVFPTSGVIDGVCYAYTCTIRKSKAANVFLWNFLSLYVIILCIFVFCYWRILVVIRRLAATPLTDQAPHRTI